MRASVGAVKSLVLFVAVKRQFLEFYAGSFSAYPEFRILRKILMIMNELCYLKGDFRHYIADFSGAFGQA